MLLLPNNLSAANIKIQDVGIRVILFFTTFCSQLMHASDALILCSFCFSVTGVVAIDCEMVGVSFQGSKSALGRVTLVRISIIEREGKKRKGGKAFHFSPCTFLHFLFSYFISFRPNTPTLLILFFFLFPFQLNTPDF